MKRTASLLLTLILCLSLCACAGTTGDDSAASTTASTTTSTEAAPDTSATTEASDATMSTTESLTATEHPTTTEKPTTEKPTTEKPTTTKKTTTAHTHSWKKATCTDPKTCSSCGATEGKAKGHSWEKATCTTPKTCKVCKATTGDVAAHSYYAGACKTCKAADKSMKRIYSKYAGFSFVLPEDWNTYEISEYENANGADGYQDRLQINSTRYCYYQLMLPVFTFHVRERGVECSDFYGGEGRTKCELVSSNKKYDLYLETVLKNGITGYSGDDIVADATDADLKELKKIIDMKEEIIASIRWE